VAYLLLYSTLFHGHPPQYPELSVASYNKNPASLSEPDGIVAVWNLHLLERPEFVFHSQSDVLSVCFSHFHSNLIFGGTYSGQILLWDTRSKHLPVLKTPLSAAGHTHPVYAIQMVGTQNAHNLITSSTDGTVCSWLVDMLAQPQVRSTTQIRPLRFSKTHFCRKRLNSFMLAITKRQRSPLRHLISLTTKPLRSLLEQRKATYIKPTDTTGQVRKRG